MTDKEYIEENYKNITSEQLSTFISEKSSPWKRLIYETMLFDEDKAWRYPFSKMCQKYGKEFIEAVQDSWACNSDCLTEDEFCYYHNLPKTFFEKKIKSIKFEEIQNEKDSRFFIINILSR